FAEICASDKKSFALCIIDIKRFRKVNESLSRMAGNTLLKQFAERLCKAAGDSIYTARIGGDIFALVVPAVSDVMRLALMLESRLKQIIEEPFDLDGTLLKVSTKVGVAMYPADGADGETLIRNAETALKKAKSSVEDYLFYSHDMTIRISESFALERKLRQALDNEEFVLYYQPKVDVETRSVVGIECLVRWLSPDYGLVPPKEFIPLLEETGLILELGAWVLRRAMEDQRKWCEAGIIAPPVAVNVSPMQLRQRAFAGLVEQAIRENAGKARIDLEITESLVMEDIENNIENLTAMRALGIEIAVDDFGTGYSSLAYLARLPVQALKIDRAFVSDMHCDPNAMMLVSTMISLAHSLRLKVIAEGVESEEQAKMLRLLRCEEMQGYLVSEPLPFDDMTILLRKQLEQSGDPVN
ncbi:MAG TPA: bifunctional diguanylate cyclase/phosphodiesterase, partial [Terracidiphilus sp.]|nr:bifunctional diguanylate cyclase/phosphodiesterase [Terracidiphilus sp.]